jgi:hypothetical protein
MNNKKGISTIVATVLIVLITVAAVTILWAAISPMLDIEDTTACIGIQNKLTIDKSPTYTNLDVHGTCVPAGGTTESTCADAFTQTLGAAAATDVKIRVERAANTGDLKEIKIILDEDGATISTAVIKDGDADFPTEGGSKVISIDLVDDPLTATVFEGEVTGTLTAKISSSVIIEGEVSECPTGATSIKVTQKA